MGRVGFVFAVAFSALALLAVPAHAAFPGANGKIAFISAFNGLSTVNPDGTGEALLPTGYLGGGYPSSWSPDGTKLLFWLNTYPDEPGEYTDTHSFVVPAEGGTGTVVGSGARGEGADVPSWSRDGSKIVFFYGTIWVMNADGSGRTDLGVQGDSPQWSPTTDRIAFEWPGGGIGTMNAEGTGVTQITNGPERRPDWSPDGNRIVFEHGFNLDVANADGTAHHRLTTDGDVIDMSPKFSPDGTKIVWSRYRMPISEPPKLWLMNADGTDQHSLGVVSDEARTIQSWQPLPIPNQPPDCSGVQADRGQLWPPNRHLRAVTLSGASDPDGDEVTLDTTGVTQDEPVAGGYDARLRGEGALLRAEREPKGDGRVYRMAFTVSDGKASCDGVATVEARRHRKKPAVDSAPPAYDSTR
jgi:WD40-like Beta Propeller Repeat